MAGIEPDWSRISEELLFSIVKLLPARIDILRLRAVCRSFRATIPLPPLQYPFPNSTLTNSNFLKGPDYPNKKDVVTLMASTVYAIEPLNGISSTQDEETPQTWVVRVNESTSGRVRVIDPVTGKYCYLSRILLKSGNLLDYRVREIGKFYYLDSAFSKVVFSSFLDEHDDEFAVMTIYGPSDLGMWRNADQKWSHVNIAPRPYYDYNYIEDIIHNGDKFYALLDYGRTVTVDPKSLIVTEVVAGLRFNRTFSMLKLVGSFNDLFLVGHYEDSGCFPENYYIEVFKLNEKKREWDQVVDGLDLIDRVLFMGESGGTFSVSVKEFPRFKGGCVYYAEYGSHNYPGQYTWIRDFRDGKFGRISVFPAYLNFFWPPPAWLKFGDSNLLDINSSEKMNMIKKDRVENLDAAEPSDRQGKRPRAEASSSHVEDQFQILTTKLDSLTSHIHDGFQTFYNRLDLIDSHLDLIDSRLNTLTDAL